MVVKLLSVIYFASMFSDINSARILAVFPMPSISHQVVFRRVTQELAKRGHDVTVITTDPAFPKGGAPANLKEIDTHDMSYKALQKQFQDDYKVNNNVVSFAEMRKNVFMLWNIFKAQLEVPEVQQILSDPDQKFDLIMLEAVVRPALVFSQIYKAPIILISSMGAVFNDHQVMGSPSHPLLFPSPINRKIYNLTFWEKLAEIYNYYSIKYAIYLNEADETAVLRQKFGPNIPTLSELYNNVDMLLVNIHPLWADNQPVPPNVIYMGGIHQMPEKQLPKDLKAYLDSSKNGVIYLSFGTNVLSAMIPSETIEMMTKVLSSLPYDVLWKWDRDELPGKSDNIKLGKWFPQSDLLRHPKVKLFITQAGLQSTDEAITAGVPLVAVPMLGDQWYNGEKYVKHGIGKSLDIDNLTEEKFRIAVETVLKDESYRKNIVKLGQVMRDQPETPLARATWWIEYVIRHGGAKQLRAASANKSYVEYFELELVSIIFLIILTVLLSFVVAIVLVIRFVRNLCCTYTAKVKVT